MISELNPKLLELIVCPKDKTPLEFSSDRNQLTCTQCRKRYNITESGIPIFLSPKDDKSTQTRNK